MSHKIIAGQQVPPFTQTIRRAIAVFGAERQLRKLQEECAELITAVNHYLEGREGAIEEIIEETGDVLIMVHQSRLIVGAKPVDNGMDEKLVRLANMLAEIENKENEGEGHAV